MSNAPMPQNSNDIRRATGGTLFPVHRLKAQDVLWLAAWGRCLADEHEVAPRLGCWVHDWAAHVELVWGLGLPHRSRHSLANPHFEDWGPDDLADATLALAGAAFAPMPLGAAKLVDRLGLLLAAEVTRRLRLQHLAEQLAGLGDGENINIRDRVYTAGRPADWSPSFQN